MSSQPQRQRSLSPTHFKQSRHGFQPLNDVPENSTMSRHNDGMMDIPLQTVVSHGSTGLRSNHTPKSPIGQSQQGTFYEKQEQDQDENGHGGRRKLAKVDSKGRKIGTGADGEDDTLTRMGMIYTKILHFSVITRYLIYVLPVAAILAVPLVVGATAAPRAHIGGVRLVWFWTWIEVVWLGLWASKVVAHFLPKVFQALMGVVSAGTRKYSLVLKAVEIPLSLVGWAVVALTTFKPAMQATLDPSKGDRLRGWQDVMIRVLGACLAATIVLLVEKLLIQLISINYHRKQFNVKIKDSKRNVSNLSLLYDASRALFPMYCREFQEEDYIINDSLEFGMGSRTNSGNQKRPGSANPTRLLQNVGRFGDKITSVFGNVAHEITGKKVFNPNSAHSIVVEALEKKRTSEALAKRIWMSLVVEGRNALYADDIAEVLGADRTAEADECFSTLDRDGNGDISLEEMILTVTELGRERKSIATSMHDVDQAINVLDGLLSTVVLIIVVFIFIAFLNTNFVTTLATAGTALLSLSFVFAATTQEVLGSCIFLFVKHPYDVGDRIDLTSGTDKLVVEHISLLFTTFRRVTNGKVVQIPNIVLNGIWIENISRSNAMRETISIFVAFDTTFADISLLKNEMQNFVRDKENARDFMPDVDIDVADICEMNKMELKCEIRHKSNWANGVVAGTRRSKFMCALVLALRKVPIYGPGGGDPALGAVGNPSYSVAVSHEQAEHQKELASRTKEESRMVPTAKTGLTYPTDTHGKAAATATGFNNLAPSAEANGISNLTARNVALDPARDDAYSLRDDAASMGRPSMDRHSMDAGAEDSMQLLHKAPSSASTGRRRAASRVAMAVPSVPFIAEPRPPTGGSDYADVPPARNLTQQPSASALGRSTSLGSPALHGSQRSGEQYAGGATTQQQQIRGNPFANQPMTHFQSTPEYPRQESPPGASTGRRVSGETARPGPGPYAQPPGGPGAYRPYGGT
ncbi:hypothetical protein EJ05DRAFT_251504 [Pseudovirgaria hyperparasitica]|uniref:EF-hand domain-containing protein n=1 Tax=Pseudovirgaria hyperparasitica TaxID=470096 RepID=A0A6A6WIP6_9PEZI|nr:uncharacterized protein EJ05DRAFT_251504 [Pseudovirgaria hyperparasitica]KAF2761071.1 hypothetical protein EJ05DRAFT_251504 [Pseudovirgaria hyperparasitica]